MLSSQRIPRTYFQAHETLFIAKDLIGKTLVRRFENGTVFRSKITETEAYIGQEDKACHAHKGKTSRTALMFEKGGLVYVYLIYGIYWMLNIVTQEQDEPHAILIRSTQICQGPGNLGKRLQLDRSFYGENLDTSNRLWIEDSIIEGQVIETPRIGIEYAGDLWKNKPWRFVLQS